MEHNHSSLFECAAFIFYICSWVSVSIALITGNLINCWKPLAWSI